MMIPSTPAEFWGGADWQGGVRAISYVKLTM